MESFWDRLSRTWPAEQPRLHWLVLPDAAAAAELTARYAGAVRAEGLSPVPAAWLHQTVLGVLSPGPPAALIDPESLEEIVRIAARACAALRPFDLAWTDPAVRTYAVELAGAPDAVAELRGVALAATNAVLDGAVPAVPSTPYRPHLSLAYAHSADVDEAALAGRLAAVAGPAVTGVAGQLDLVVQWYGGAAAETTFGWRTLARIPLGRA